MFLFELKLLKKKPKLLYASKRKQSFSLDRIINSFFQIVLTLLYELRFFKFFFPRTHGTLKNYASMLNDLEEPNKGPLPGGEEFLGVTLVYTATTPIEYLPTISQNLLSLMNKHPFYNAHGSLSTSIDDKREILNKLKDSEDFNTYSGGFLCDFDLSRSELYPLIGGIQITYNKADTTSICFVFTITTTPSFTSIFRNICHKQEARSSAVQWNDWKLIIRGYKLISGVSNTLGVRKESYKQLIEDIHKDSKKIVFAKLLSGVDNKMISVSDHSIIYKVDDLNSFKPESKIFETFHGKPRYIFKLDSFNYYECFWGADVYVVSDENYNNAYWDIARVIFDVSSVHYYKWLYQSIKNYHFKLNTILYELITNRHMKFLLYGRVTELKLKIVFLKNMYVRADKPSRQGKLIPSDTAEGRLEILHQERKSWAFSNIDKILKTLTEITDDANSLTTSYFSSVIQIMALLLAILALPMLSDVVKFGIKTLKWLLPHFDALKLYFTQH